MNVYTKCFQYTIIIVYQVQIEFRRKILPIASDKQNHFVTNKETNNLTHSFEITHLARLAMLNHTVIQQFFNLDTRTAVYNFQPVQWELLLELIGIVQLQLPNPQAVAVLFQHWRNTLQNIFFTRQKKRLLLRVFRYQFPQSHLGTVNFR